MINLTSQSINEILINPFLLIIIGIICQITKPLKMANLIAMLYFGIFTINQLNNYYTHVNNLSLNTEIIFQTTLGIVFFTSYTLFYFFEKKTNIKAITYFNTNITQPKHFLKNINLLAFAYFSIFILTSKSINTLQESKDFLSILLVVICLELVSICSFIFILQGGDFTNKKLFALRYLTAHFTAGMLLITAIFGYDNNFRFQFPLSLSINDNNFILNCLLFLGLYINCGLPIFSFWFIQAYTAANFVFFLILSTGISKLSTYLLIMTFGGNHWLSYVGTAGAIFCLILLFYESNIKKFLCLTLIAHNSIMLVSGSIFWQNQFLVNSIFFHSIIGQVLLFTLIYCIQYGLKNKSDYFAELKIPINQHKILFILSVIINLLFIGSPFTANFQVKSELFNLTIPSKSLLHDAKYLIYISTINAHLYIFQYRLFGNQKTNFIDRKKYLKIITFLSLLIIIYFLMHKDFIRIDPHQNWAIQYSYLVAVNGLVFLLIHKMFYKNYLSFYTSDIWFNKIKEIAIEIIIFYKNKEKKFLLFCGEQIDILQNNLFIKPSNKKYNTYQYSNLVIFYLGIIIISVILLHLYINQ